MEEDEAEYIALNKIIKQIKLLASMAHLESRHHDLIV